MHGLLQEPPEEHLSLSILSFQNFYGGICLYLGQLSAKLVLCRLSFVCYHCLEYVRSGVSNYFCSGATLRRPRLAEGVYLLMRVEASLGL